MKTKLRRKQQQKPTVTNTKTDTTKTNTTTNMTYQTEPVTENRPGDPTSSFKAVVLAGTSVPVGKHARPSMKRFNDRRLSLKVRESLGKADKATLNNKQSQSLRWARSIAEK